MANQTLKQTVKALFYLLCFFIAGVTNAQTKKEIKPGIYHIQNYFSEVYLVKGNNEKLILIETGVPVAGYQDSLVSSIKKWGFKPENITLAIVTHGHGDHAGNAKFLQQTYHIPIAGSKADLGKFTSGKTELVKCEDVSIWGTRLRAYSDLSYQPFTPDVLVDDATIDLTKYGINGKIIPINGGHTPGDILVLIGENLFVGDAFVGTFKEQGGQLIPDGHHVREHFYHENKTLASQNLQLIQKIVLDNKVITLYPTHNGPVTSHEFKKYLKEESLLNILSNQVIAMLSAVVKGQYEVQNKVLSNDFVLQTANGLQFTKAGYIDAYIKNPTDKLESLTAEDFRIVSSTENTIVMTYIESQKSEGKEATTIFVNQIYSKVKGDWKLVHKQFIK